MPKSSSKTIDAAYVEGALYKGCESLGITLTAKQISLLSAYVVLFVKWNASYNLSAIRDIDGIISKHLLDSLTIVPLINTHLKGRANSTLHIADIGTGGGLPGIVLAICFPTSTFTLVDSAGKKMRFLFQVKTELGLDNVSLEATRVEQFAPPSGFDIVISRAFSSLQSFTHLCRHLLKDNGQYWAMKGIFPDEELSEMGKHYIVIEHHALSVPGLDDKRCLLRLGVDAANEKNAQH